jgi:XTP/dITP diphosphohydrolase
MLRKLLLATNNNGKVTELRHLLEGIPFDLVTLREAGITSSAEETGTTYEENARIKALASARQSGLMALADDSGLEVDALNGEPGIMSARYAGEHASDGDRVKYLLGKLAGVPWERRTARFVCVIVIATPEGETAQCEGRCAGLIGFEPKGAFGFGYDPIFYFPELGKTMAELTEAEKDRISHRGRAAAGVPLLLSKPPFRV